MLCGVQDLLLIDGNKFRPALKRVFFCCFSFFFFRHTFVSILHVFLFKHQVVTLHCSRVELQPENNLPLWIDVTFMIAFNLQRREKHKNTAVTKASVDDLCEKQTNKQKK